jgi:hypothetical protein
MRCVLAFVALIGCSSTSKPPTTVPPTLAAPPKVAAPTVEAKSVEAEPSDDIPDDDMPIDGMDGTLEQAEVKGEGITVEVSWFTMTGSMHVAEDIAITTARGTLALASPEDPDSDDAETLPLIEQIYNAGPNRWVLLGWSSYGSGMQSEHAWLVDGAASPRIVDKLQWTTDRAHAGLAIDTGTKLRIGIPLPVISTTRDDDGTEEHSLHAESDWQLSHGARTWTLGKVAKLPASSTHVMAVRAYTPPFQASASELGWSGRFVWFTAEKRFVRR